MKPIIEIQESPPNAMCFDLGRKFADDLRALITRSLAIMVPFIGGTNARDIVLSSLASVGLMIEEAGDSPPGSFAAMVETAVKYKSREPPGAPK